MESNDFINPTSKLYLAKQDLSLTYSTIPYVLLQSAFSRAIITHTFCLNPPPPLLAILSDAGISAVHLFS